MNEGSISYASLIYIFKYSILKSILRRRIHLTVMSPIIPIVERVSNNTHNDVKLCSSKGKCPDSLVPFRSLCGCANAQNKTQMYFRLSKFGIICIFRKSIIKGLLFTILNGIISCQRMQGIFCSKDTRHELTNLISQCKTSPISIALSID